MNPRPHRSAPPGFREPTEQEIQHAAYRLWEEAGRPLGRDWEIWFAARERLKHQLPAPSPSRRGPAEASGLSEKSGQAILAD